MFHAAPRLAAILAAALIPLTAQEDPAGAALQEDAPARPVTGPLALFTWADFDGDGLMDAFVIQPDGSGHLLRNRGDGSFEREGERRGLSETITLTDAAWSDYDGDGRVDLLLASPARPLQLWRQTEKGTFVDQAQYAGLLEVEGALKVEWRDLDGDGRVDLRVSTVSRDRLFQNAGDGRLVELDLSLEYKLPFGNSFGLLSGPFGEKSLPPEARAKARTGPSGGGSIAAGPGVGVSGTASGAGPQLPAGPVLGCASGIDDMAAPGNCIPASTVATLGALYPMTLAFNVDPATRWVGINKILPDTRLHVVGQGRFQGDSDLSTIAGTGMLQVFANDGVSGLGLDANEIQTWGADLSINEDNLFGTSINSTVFVTTAGSVGINMVPGASVDLDVAGIVRAGDTIVSTKPAGAPFQIASADVSANLNADLLDGFDASSTPALGSLYPLSTDLNVDAAGYVGMGTTTPESNLHIKSGIASTGIRLESTNPGSGGDTHIDFRAEGGERFLVGWDESSDVFRIFSASQSANIFNIADSTGNVGIGTDTPSFELQVEGTIDADGLHLATGAQAGHVLTSDATGIATWQEPADNVDGDWVVIGHRMYAGVSGNVGIGTTTPDYPLEVVGTIASSMTTGAPFSVGSTDLNTNLNADLLDGLHASAFSQLGSSIEGSEITDGSITGADIENSTITGLDIWDGTLTGDDILIGSIDGSDIQNDSVTGADIWDGTLTGADIQDGSVTSADIQDDSVNSSDIQDGTIGDADISNDEYEVIDGDKIQPHFIARSVWGNHQPVWLQGAATSEGAPVQVHVFAQQGEVGMHIQGAQQDDYVSGDVVFVEGAYLSRGVVANGHVTGVAGYAVPFTPYGLGEIPGEIGVLGSGPLFGVYSAGTLGVSGLKLFVQPHPTDPDLMVRFACQEGNEVGTYFRGSGMLVDGMAVIEVPEDFRMVTSPDDLTVQITPRGPSLVWVEFVDLERVVVRGQVDVPFDYRVEGLRAGFEGFETITENTAFVPKIRGHPMEEYLPPHVERLMIQNGTLNPDLTPNEATAQAQGWELRDPSPQELERFARRDAMHAVNKE